MTGERLDSNHPELQNHNDKNRKTMMAMLAVYMQTDPTFDDAHPEKSELIALPDNDPGLLGVVELVLPLPDKIAVNSVNALAKEIGQATQLVEDLSDGDMGQAVADGLNLVVPAIKPSITTGEVVFDRASQLAADISSKIKRDHERKLAA